MEPATLEELLSWLDRHPLAADVRLEADLKALIVQHFTSNDADSIEDVVNVYLAERRAAQTKSYFN